MSLLFSARNLNEYLMHVLIVDTNCPTSMHMALANPAVKERKSKQSSPSQAMINARSTNCLGKSLQPRSSVLKFPTPCKTHHIVCVYRRSDLPEPLHIPTIHILQRCTVDCVIHVFRRMRHILPIRKSSSADCLCDIANHIGHLFIERRVRPLECDPSGEYGL